MMFEQRAYFKISPLFVIPFFVGRTVSLKLFPVSLVTEFMFF